MRVRKDDTGQVSTTGRLSTCRQPPSSQPIAVNGRRADAAGAPALHVRGAEPQVRRARFAQIPPEQLGDSLHFARRRARGAHLGHRRGHGAVGSLVALDDVLGEEAAAAQLGYAQRDVADARGQVALAVAVAAVGASGAQLVDLGVHHRVDRSFTRAIINSLRLFEPSSNLGIIAYSGMLSARLSIAAFVLSQNPLCRNSRF